MRWSAPGSIGGKKHPPKHLRELRSPALGSQERLRYSERDYFWGSNRVGEAGVRYRWVSLPQQGGNLKVSTEAPTWTKELKVSRSLRSQVILEPLKGNGHPANATAAVKKPEQRGWPGKQSPYNGSIYFISRLIAVQNNLQQWHGPISEAGQTTVI